MEQDEQAAFEKLEDVGREFLAIVEERDQALLKLNTKLGLTKRELEKADKTIEDRNDTIEELRGEIEILEDYKARVKQFANEG